MYELVKFFSDIFLQIYSIMNVRFFPDFPLGFIDLSIVCLVISFMFKFAFGGLKEVEYQGNYFNNYLSSRAISNLERKKQINNSSNYLNSIHNDTRAIRKYLDDFSLMKHHPEVDVSYHSY